MTWSAVGYASIGLLATEYVRVMRTNYTGMWYLQDPQNSSTWETSRVRFDLLILHLVSIPTGD